MLQGTLAVDPRAGALEDDPAGTASVPSVFTDAHEVESVLEDGPHLRSNSREQCKLMHKLAYLSYSYGVWLRWPARGDSRHPPYARPLLFWRTRQSCHHTQAIFLATRHYACRDERWHRSAESAVLESSDDSPPFVEPATLHELSRRELTVTVAEDAREGVVVV